MIPSISARVVARSLKTGHDFRTAAIIGRVFGALNGPFRWFLGGDEISAPKRQVVISIGVSSADGH
jgi:hypothetical protein